MPKWQDEPLLIVRGFFSASGQKDGSQSGNSQTRNRATGCGLSMYCRINATAYARQTDEQCTDLTYQTFDENKGVYPMRFVTPIFGFCLGLLKNPVYPVGAKLMELFDLLNRNDWAVGFMLLDG